MGPDGEAVMSREILEEGIELAAGQAYLSHVIVENTLRHASEVDERPLLAADESGNVHTLSEFDVEHAREGEYHHEGVDLLPLDFTHVRPIRLCLISGRRLETNGGFLVSLVLISEGLEEALHQIDASGEALGADLLQQTRGGEAVLLPSGGEVGFVRVQARGALRLLERLGCLLFQQLVDGVTGLSRTPGDLSLGEALVVQIFDFHPRLRLNHVGLLPPIGRWKGSPKCRFLTGSGSIL
jgi:hypothetical protein